MDGLLRVELAEDGADAERLDELTAYLRTELLELDVDDVTTEPAGPPPLGTRAADVTAIGALLVKFGTAAKSVAAVVATVRKWLARGDGVRRTIRLEMDGDVIELSHATPGNTDKLVDLFVAKHAK